MQKNIKLNLYVIEKYYRNLLCFAVVIVDLLSNIIFSEFVEQILVKYVFKENITLLFKNFSFSYYRIMPK